METTAGLNQIRPSPLGGRATSVLKAVFYASVLVLSAGLVLSIASWKTTEVFHGPFVEQSPWSGAFLIRLGQGSIHRKILGSRGDTPDAPNRSDLELWVNGQSVGPAHSPFENIRNHRSGSYLHWGEAVVFSLPEWAENSASTSITAKYRLGLRDKVLRGAFAALLGSAFLLGIWLRRDEHLHHRLAATLRWAGRILQFLFYFAFLMAALYLVTIPYGIARGFALPTTAVFTLVPGVREFALHEPRVHYELLAYSMIGVLCSWIGTLAPALTRTVHITEQALTRGFNRYGLVIALSLFLFSASATWYGVPRPEDFAGVAVVGLVPFNDAHGYFQASFDQVTAGSWGYFAERRPVAAALRSVMMFFAGYSNLGFLLLQTTGLAAAGYFAARAVAQWRGIWAGLGFLAMTFALVRPYLTTTMTEPLGLFWALLAIPFVVRALRFGFLADAAVGLFAVCISLLARMGSMFTIPAFALWMVMTQAWNRRRMGFATLLAGLVLAIGIGMGQAGLGLYGSGKNFAGSNFSYTACGLAHGGDWATCVKLYQEEFGKIGGTEADLARYLLHKAWVKFREEPAVLLERLSFAERFFADHLVERSLIGYMSVSPPGYFPLSFWYLVVGTGLVFVLVRRRERHELSFWILMALGLFTSAPWVILDDGWRVMCTSFPFIALFLASGLCAPATYIPSLPRPASDVPGKMGLALAAATTLACLTVPGIARWSDRLETRDLEKSPPGPGEVVILGGKHLAGLLVVPDDSARPIDLPAVPLASFVQVVRYSGIEQYQRLVTPQPPPAPFGFVAAPAIGGGGRIFIVPPQVVERQDVAAWRLHLEDLRADEPGYWFRVASATPVKTSGD